MRKKERFLKICIICGKEFLTPNEFKETCGTSCGMKHKWNNPEYKESLRKKYKDYQGSEEGRLKNSIAQKEAQNRTNVKEANRLRGIEIQQRPGMRERISEKMKQIKGTDENREFYAELMRQRWTDTEFRNTNISKITSALNAEDAKQKISEFQKAFQNRPDIREQTSKRSKEYMNRPEVRLAKSIEMQNKWKDENFAISQFKSRYKYKRFELPSGKIVNLQGYEPQVLTELLKTYTEEDIVIGVKEINLETGKIIYAYGNGTHAYYPDFYIKSENKIIEVKSYYTYNSHLDRNLAKMKACINMGFEFEFKIL